MLQQGGFTSPALPGGAGISLPPGMVAPGTVTTGPAAQTVSPGNMAVSPTQLPINPNAALPINPNFGIPSSSDLAPLQQPQLSSGFANVDNCNCVSGPSHYRAASGYGCGSTLGYVAPQSYNAPVAQIPAPAVMPQTIAPGMITPGAVMPVAPSFAPSAPPRAVISLGQQNYPVQVGQGLWGQPVAYVPGQAVRNWVRYFFP